jgi:hypothetical protein
MPELRFRIGLTGHHAFKVELPLDLAVQNLQFSVGQDAEVFRKVIIRSEMQFA